MFGERSLGRHDVGVGDFLRRVVNGDLEGNAFVAINEIGGGSVGHFGVDVLEVESEDEIEQADADVFEDDGGGIEVLRGVELQIPGEAHEGAMNAWVELFACKHGAESFRQAHVLSHARPANNYADR